MENRGDHAVVASDVTNKFYAIASLDSACQLDGAFETSSIHYDRRHSNVRPRRAAQKLGIALFPHTH
jgi:hypothetical protein